MTTRMWFRIHSFTGVITGLMLFVICWSGTFAVLADEIDWLVTPEARAKADGSWASWGDWLAAVRGAYLGAEVLWLEAPRYAASAAVAVINPPDQDLVRVYIDPHRAEILGHGSYYTAQRFFRNLHMSLFLPHVGIYLVSAFSISMLISLAGALLFYRRWWRRFFDWPAGRGPAFWSRLHKTGGVWSIWFVVVISLTGCWYLFEMARYDFIDGKFSFAGTDGSSVHLVPEPSSPPHWPELALDELVEHVRAARSELLIQTVGPGFSHEGVLYVDGQAGQLLVRDRANQLHLDTRTGAVLFDQQASTYPLYWRWSDTANPLHFGDFGGLWSKGAWFVFGLLLSGLILTGTWLHARRLARESSGANRHRWPGTGAALLVSFALLVAAVPAALDQAATAYGPTIDGVSRLPTLASGVAAVIVGWTAVTLLIIAVCVVLLWRPPVVLRTSAAGRRAAARPAPLQRNEGMVKK